MGPLDSGRVCSTALVSYIVYSEKMKIESEGSKFRAHGMGYRHIVGDERSSSGFRSLGFGCCSHGVWPQFLLVESEAARFAARVRGAATIVSGP